MAGGRRNAARPPSGGRAAAHGLTVSLAICTPDFSSSTSRIPSIVALKSKVAGSPGPTSF